MDALSYTLGIGGIIINNAPLLVGFVMPPFVEMLNKDVPAERERKYLSILACFIVAILLHWKDIELGTPQMAVAYFVLIYGEMNVLFRFYFGDSQLRTVLQNKFNTSWLDTTPQS